MTASPELMTRPRFATVRLSSGPHIHYAEQGDVTGDPILFLHGWPDSWFTFSRMLPFLADRLHVFVPDQRGFGDSDRPNGPYGIPEFAADVVAFLDAVGVDRATLVGHSFGSFVARRVAFTNPERVGRLILIGTGVSAATPAVRAAQADLQGLQAPIPPTFAREFQASTAYVPLPDAFFERIVRESLKLPARLWREVLDRLVAYDDWQQLPLISAPTLLIWGEHDVLFSREHQERLLAVIRGASLLNYAETGHCPNWERPEQVASDLQAFCGTGGG
jgi:non-heme chloroperoxidase